MRRKIIPVIKPRRYEAAAIKFSFPFVSAMMLTPFLLHHTMRSNPASITHIDNLEHGELLTPNVCGLFIFPDFYNTKDSVESGVDENIPPTHLFNALSDLSTGNFCDCV
jgi:hypothetical protein